MKIARAALLGSVAAIPFAVLAPSAAHAQLADAAVAPGENAPIIVTARRQEETLQTAPVTVSVATAESIEELNLQDLSDIAKTTAGLTFDNETGRDSNRPVIRGQANILGDSGVATFIDGIYVTGSIADYNIDDIERLEVVKGPQSALYGRNTYSGAINIITRTPSDEFGGRVSVDISEDDRYEVSGSLEGGLAPGLTAGLTGRWYDFGGEYENPTTGEAFGDEESWSLSGVLAYEPEGSPFRARLRAYYSEIDDGQAALYAVPATENNCFFDNGALYGGGGRYYCGEIRTDDITAIPSLQLAAGNDPGNEITTLNLSAMLEFELGENLTLTSLTGYNDRDTIFRADADYAAGAFQTAVFTPGGFPAGAPIGFGPAGPIFPFGYAGSTVDFTFENNLDTDEWSQEFRLFYEGDRVRALLGGYFYDGSRNSQDIRELPANAAAQAGASFGAAFAQQQALCAANPICGSIAPFFGPAIPESRDRTETDVRNLAIFGSLSFDLTDELEISVEARYASEKVEQLAIEQDNGGPVINQATAEETFDSFDPRVVLSYQATPDNLFYGVFATGIKPGGFNGVTAINAGVPSYDQEESTSYEIGTKNTFGGGSFLINGAFFYNEIEGYQLTQNVRSGPNTVSAITNAGDAEVFGFELETVLRPDRHWTFTANYTFLDAQFTEGFDENQGVLNDVADDGLVNCSLGDEFPSTPDCESAFGSIAGKRIPRTARHAIFADADYTRPIGGGWEMFLGTNVSLQTSRFAQVHNLAETGDTLLWNARAGLRSDRYRIHFYVNNITDDNSTPFVLRYADADNSFRRSFVGSLRRGRHFGVALGAEF